MKCAHNAAWMNNYPCGFSIPKNLGASRMVKTSGWSFLHHTTMLTVPDG
ncbi:hypothetical protein Lpp221_13569 [Lacticaseibacillus paracasei subsp. paracasei Lpp221]|nr:hypothetical protein Lpp221_13569 [Lacticaseibacillus paracasei subsp. paracasei Lpp221]